MGLKDIRPLSKLSSKEVDQFRMLRWKARTDLGFLCREILNYPDVSDDVHGPILNILQKFPKPNKEQFYANDDIVNGKWVYTPIQRHTSLTGKRKKLILDPRGWLKTTINAQSHTIQWLLNYPDIAIMIVQSNLDKAIMILGEIKRHFQYNPLFRQLFPEHCPTKSIDNFGTMAEFTTLARGKHITRKEESVSASSITAGSSGIHVDVIKYSDIVEPSNTGTEDQMAKVTEGFYMSQNLLVGPKYWIDVEGTRYDFGDTYGEIIDLDKKTPEDKKDWAIHARGCYKKKTPDGSPQKFTPDELLLPDLIVDGKKVLHWQDEERGLTLDHYEMKRMEDPYIFSCSRGDQKILMADFTEKAIKDIQIGDEIVGFGKVWGKNNQLIKTKVIGSGHSPQQLYKIVTDQTRVTYQTADHKWFNATNGTYNEVKLGSSLFSCYKPYPDVWNRQVAGWLGGFFDGEGSIHKSYGITIYQSEQKNPLTYKKLKESIKILNFDFAEFVDDRRGVSQFALRGGRSEKLRFMHCCQPVKQETLHKAIWGSNPVESNGRHTIISMEPSTFEDAYWLETESGNYVVSGFLSKNCQQLNHPAGGVDGKAIFPVEPGKYPAMITRENFTQNVRVSHYIATVDTAETTGKRSNYTAITVAAFADDGRVYINEIIHGKFLPHETVALICNLVETDKKKRKYVYGSKLRAINVEETGFMRGLNVALQSFQQLTGTYLPLNLIKRDNQTAKIERIQNALQPYYMSKKLIFLDDITDWANVEKELREFPKSKSDDILDTLADVFQDKQWFGREKSRLTPSEFKSTAWARMLDIENPFGDTVGYDLGTDAKKGFDDFYNKTGGL